eukprot:gnl/MRDRNA2_/MRDRNA2_116487_c0_seq1.p1 gnl/MRDRNA2_/MRDRNA2_116487_c0~~gnl/MRDRNA2_/MRDRNA2_116487_c0_seq1.p1  ORF type:complete len:266 (+),score=51.29 gnl/MRDRNA2_/MRDRNA2_116487_c0_seq1:56-799(+)
MFGSAALKRRNSNSKSRASTLGATAATNLPNGGWTRPPPAASNLLPPPPVIAADSFTGRYGAQSPTLAPWRLMRPPASQKTAALLLQPSNVHELLSHSMRRSMSAPSSLDKTQRPFAGTFDPSATFNESATGLKLQMLHLAQDLGEVRRRHISTRDLAHSIVKDKSQPNKKWGNEFAQEVDDVKKSVGQDIQAAFAEMHSFMAELHEETTQMMDDCDKLQDDDANMGALLRRMGSKLRDIEQNVGHS